MKRRSFLGAAIAAPVAAPQIVGEARFAQNFPTPFTGAVPDYAVEHIAGMRSALNVIDDVPDDYFIGIRMDYGPYTSLRSVSLAVKTVLHAQRYAEQERARRKQRLIDQIDEAMGKPLSGWRKFARWL